MYYKKYSSKRIYLSPLDVDDFKLYTKWINDEKISRGINQIHKVINENIEKEWLLNAYKKGRYQFAVVDNSTDKPIGIYGLELKNSISKQYFFVGFIGESKYRGKGYGTEALTLLTKFAFEILNAHSLYTTIYNYNIESIKSANKAGYKKCGQLKEAIYYNSKYYNEIFMEMTKEDYLKKFNTIKKTTNILK